MPPTTTPAVEFVPPTDLVVGDVIDFFGEFHTIERIVTASGPLVDAGLAPADRIALADGGTWQLTLASPLVPVLRAGR
jgi:hypothetical protein